MIHEAELLSCCGGSADDPRYGYLLDIARRLEALGLSNLGEYEAMVLLALLAQRSVRFADGSELDELFIAEAAGIAACLAASVVGKDWYWYKVHHPSYASDCYAQFVEDQNALVVRLRPMGLVID